jgi:intracellular multiplication protein IcmK
MTRTTNHNWLIKFGHVLMLLMLITNMHAQQYSNPSSASSVDMSSQAQDNQSMAPPTEKIEPVTLKDLGVDSSIADDAFNSVAQTVSPLSPDQAMTIRHLWNESQRMTTFRGSAPPEPVNRSKVISLDNGRLPTVVRLSAGYVSVISFYDSTGAIWPVRGYDIGNPTSVNIVWNEGTREEETAGESFANTLLLQAQTLYKTTNLVVMLRGLNTPVILELIPGQQQVDYRMDIQVPMRGPLAKATDTTDSISPNQVNGDLVNLINNIPPVKSVQAHVTGGDAQAWIHRKRLLVRTPLELISPAWTSKVNGANGRIHVYELPLTSSLIALKNGEIVKLNIEGI